MTFSEVQQFQFSFIQINAFIKNSFHVLENKMY